MTLAMRLCLRLALIALVSGGLPAKGVAKTLIHAGRLIDGRADTARTSVTVTVDGDRIVASPTDIRRAGAWRNGHRSRERDADAGPDGHARAPHQRESGAAGYAEQFFLNPADFALRATTYAKKTLMAGFTTVRDCGAGDKLNLALRDAVAKGWIVGPAHRRGRRRDDHRRSRRRHQRPGDGAAGSACARSFLAPRTGPTEMRAGVRQRYKDGADFIKIAATGGVLSLAEERSGAAFHRRGAGRRGRRPHATTAWTSPPTRMEPRACSAPCAPACTRSSTAPT